MPINIGFGTLAGDPSAAVKRLLQGNDIITGTLYNDTIEGYIGDDLIYGNAGDDVLFGDVGDDDVDGGTGDDIIIASAGYDNLKGGPSRDMFIVDRLSGHARISDFTDRVDKIYLGSSGSSFLMTRQGDDIFLYQKRDLMAIVEDAAGDLTRQGKFLV